MEEQTCRYCGCTDRRACEGGCYWVNPGYCSACADRHMDQLVEAAAAWVEKNGMFTGAGRHRRLSGTMTCKDLQLGGRPCVVTIGATGLAVTDHLGVEVFSLTPDTAALAAHYDALEVRALFADETRRAA
jgi:hypothetical protein